MSHIDWVFWFTLLAGMAMGAGATLAVQWIVRREEESYDTTTWDEVRAAMNEVREAGPSEIPVIRSEFVPPGTAYLIDTDSVDPESRAKLLAMSSLDAAKLRHPAYKITDIGGGS